MRLPHSTLCCQLRYREAFAASAPSWRCHGCPVILKGLAWLIGSRPSLHQHSAVLRYHCWSAAAHTSYAACLPGALPVIDCSARVQYLTCLPVCRLACDLWTRLLLFQNTCGVLAMHKHTRSNILRCVVLCLLVLLRAKQVAKQYRQVVSTRARP